VGQRFAAITCTVPAAVDRLIGVEYPLHHIDQMGSDIRDRLSLLFDVEEPGGSQVRHAATI